MEYAELKNGVKVPLLGLGTFMISPEDTEKSVYTAIKTGYRLIDTANAYMNEEAVGRGIRKALDEGLVTREELFISTKLWPTVYESCYAVDDTLKRLGLDWVDLLFIHQLICQRYRMLHNLQKFFTFQFLDRCCDDRCFGVNLTKQFQ